MRIHCFKNNNNNNIQGCAIFQKSSGYLKILGARRMAGNKLHTEDSKTLGTTVQNLVAMAIWRLRFVHT
jgi:hypothetical protein